MSEEQLPPPFVVGEKYVDRFGEYTVTATDGLQITIERADGRQTVDDAIAKARIHRNILVERDALGANRGRPRAVRRGATGRRKALMTKILQIESDGADHSGVDIDRRLASAAAELGYSVEDVFRLLPHADRSVFANDGDWAKAKLTEDRLHDVVGTAVRWVGGARRQCNVYRITSWGLDELRRCG